MSSLGERRRAELGAKRRALLDELDYWSGLSAADGPLEKHASQILRLRAVLEAAVHQVDVEGMDVEGRDAEGAGPARWPEVTTRLLGLHHVWDFFRSRLALRLVGRFRPALVVADELAWRCSRPVLDAAIARGGLDAAAVREPALVCFDSGASPFAVARNHVYRTLLPARPLDEVAAGLVRSLPVPVIGVPWHQQAHLPETAIVAHEIGHVLDDDLDLVAALRPAVAAALAGDAGAADWDRWLPEVLADVLAVLQLGPAYALALGDVLAGAPAQPPGDLRYPPPPTRLALVAAVAARAGHPAAALPGSGPGSGGLVAAVVEVLLTTPLPVLGAGLADVARFTAADDGKAAADAERLLARYPPRSTDVRVLVAAGVRAFHARPGRFSTPTAKPASDPPALLLQAVEAARPTGIRGAGGTPSAAAEHDRAAGAALLRVLG